MFIGIPLMIFLVLLISLVGNQSASNDSSVVVVAKDGFSVPFESTSYFSVTSEFGSRLDPLGSGASKFHAKNGVATAELLNTTKNNNTQLLH